MQRRLPPGVGSIDFMWPCPVLMLTLLRCTAQVAKRCGSRIFCTERKLGLMNCLDMPGAA